MQLFFLLVYTVLIIQFNVIPLCNGFGLLASIGVGVGSIVVGTICRFKECCNEYSIPADFDGLEKALREHIYGQHLVQDVVVNALRSHWNNEHRPQKALTLSFHGWPGSGKNYVSRFIVDSLYKSGSKSKFVHHFIGRLHFPSNDKVTQYQEELFKWIHSNVSDCGKHTFIFDEVDKMPPKVLDVIKPMIDYRDDVDGVDYRDAIFIFLSNTGADLINEHYLDLWKKQGIKRDDLKMRDFESLITKGSFNEEGSFLPQILQRVINFITGGFQYSDAIKSNLIDHYVPFLPMEKRHVRLCILDEFRQRNVTDPGEDHINEAMEFIEWGPSTEKLFSTTGCKRISQKVGAIIAKYKLSGR